MACNAAIAFRRNSLEHEDHAMMLQQEIIA
jgi:hypothetical protein